MNKNYLKLVPLVIILLISILGVKYELYHLEHSMTGQEFQERFDDEVIVQHFKEKYPIHYLGRVGNVWTSSSPSWSYSGIINDSNNVPELHLQESFGKYEFVYTCYDLTNGYIHFQMTNPTKEYIDNKLC